MLIPIMDQHYFNKIKICNRFTFKERLQKLIEFDEKYGYNSHDFTEKTQPIPRVKKCTRFTYEERLQKLKEFDKKYGHKK